MIKFKNINGDVFLAVGSIKRKSALNGEKSLTGTLFEGDDVLNKIDKGWSLEFDNEPYVVTYFERNDNDNTVEFDAIHKFFWDMNKSVLYSSASGSHTAKWYLDQIFNGTGYTYALNFDPSAFEKDNWGMKNKLSLFNDAISGMGGEFEINGTLVSIFKNIGSDLSTIVRHGFNLSDMSLENDNTDFVTYGEGFGAYADQENQTGERLHVTYTSPLEKTFGKLHAEPIDDQRYTIKDNLLQAIKDKVDGSFAISIKLSLYDLTAAGYPYKMANVGDWLLAIDENLEFKQKIRIISVDDEFATDGTRISYTVTCGDIGVVQKYQQANASIGQKVDSAYQNAQDAKESSIQAVIAANGKNTNYWFDSKEEMDAFKANEGDMAFLRTGDGEAMYIYTKLPDGSFKWVKRLDPDTGEQIAAGVDLAIETAQSQAAAMDEVRASEAAVFQSEANAALSSAAAERAVFSSNATSMANSAASRASSLANSAAVYGKAQATSALSSANSALTTAKTDLTDDISVAKSEAIEATKTADGLIHQEVTSTAASITQTISQNKSEADGKISTAQTTATQALNGLSAKVSQTDYDAKTGALDRAVGSAALTADSAALSITKYQSTADGKLNSQAAVIDANSKAIKLKVSQSDYDNKTQELSTQYGQVKTTADAVTTEVAKYKETNDKKVNTNTANITTLNNEIDSKVSQTVFDEKTGDLDGKYSETKQTVDSISNIVTELQAKANAQGQINQLLNTEFTPDMQGWDMSETWAGVKTPYRQYIYQGSNMLTFDTRDQTDKKYSSIKQTIPFATSGSNRVVSLSWWSRISQGTDLYASTHIRSYDASMTKLNDVAKGWDNGSNMTLNKFENVSIPDEARFVEVTFAVREGYLAFLAKPMFVYQSTVGTYVQGVYNNNARVTALELDINGIHGLVDDPSKGLSATWNLASDGQSIAVQAKTAASTADGKAVAAQELATTATTTAKGVQTTVTDVQKDVKDLQSKTVQTAGQVTTEIEDRKNGDKSVVTQMSDLIDQRITDTKDGYESAISQSADTIMASVSTPNQLINTEFTPDLEGWSASNSDITYAGISKSVTVNGSNVLNITHGSNTNWSRYSQQISDFVVGGTLSASVYARATSTGWGFAIDSYNSSGTRTIIKQVTIPTSSTLLKIENVTIPSDATQLHFSIWGNTAGTAVIYKPMLVFSNTVPTYMVGSATNSSTVLTLLKDNWGIGIADNIGLITNGIIGDNKSISLISDNVVIKSPSTQITGTAWITSAMIKDGAIGNAQIGNAAISSAQIINVDVSKISGNIANFITGNINTLNSRVLYGDTGHLTTVDTGLIINNQDDHLQLASHGQYDVPTKRAQFELLGYADNIDSNMQGSLNYYKNPHNAGTGLGIRFYGNQILAIDEAVSTGNLYLSPYASGQVQVVNRDRNGFQDIKASKFVTSSERKYKSKIEDFNDDALELVNGLNIRKYVKNNEDEIGVIADETDERILDKANTGVDLYSFVSVLTKAVQELTDKVEDLENERTSNQ